MDTMDSFTKDFERVEIEGITYRKGFDYGRGINDKPGKQFLVLALFLKDNGRESEHYDVLFGDEASVPVMAHDMKQRYQRLRM